MKEENKEIAPADLVEMDFLEKVMVRLPRDVDVLEALGDLYTRVGRYEDGLKVDQQLTTLEPDDMTIWYNLACSLALLNRREPALQALRHAIKLGYSDYEWMSRDRDLDSLRNDREFKTLLKRIANPVTKSTPG
jgi:tetratricopeptide (TPR) repeat protein